MPFTPFHMGPGILVKSLLRGGFSLVVFGWSQIVIDIQPLIAILSGVGKLHGITHTYAGATIIAIISAITGKYLAQWFLDTILHIEPAPVVRWWVAFLSAFIGTYSHVVLDSVMHSDMEPLYPATHSNALLGIISLAALHKLCIYSGLVGAALYFAVGMWVARHNKAMQPTCEDARG